MCSFLSTTTSGRLPCDESIGWQVEVGVLPQHDFPAIGSPPLWGNKNMEIMRYINTWFQYLSALKKICPYINSNHFGSYLCPFSSPLRSSCWCCTWSTCWNHHLTLAAQQIPRNTGNIICSTALDSSELATLSPQKLHQAKPSNHPNQEKTKQPTQTPAPGVALPEISATLRTFCSVPPTYWGCWHFHRWCHTWKSGLPTKKPKKNTEKGNGNVASSGWWWFNRSMNRWINEWMSWLPSSQTVSVSNCRSTSLPSLHAMQAPPKRHLIREWNPMFPTKTFRARERMAISTGDTTNWVPSIAGTFSCHGCQI